MKKFLMMIAAVAGISMFAMSGNAEAGCRYGGGYGGYYAPPVRYAPVNYGYSRSFYGNSFNRGYHGHPGIYGNRGFSGNRNFYGNRGFYGSGFGIQTRNFGLYVR